MKGDAGEAHFAESASRIFGQCALLLGWRPDEFWSATPAEIASIRGALHGPEDSASVSRAEFERLLEMEKGQ